jgi:hypothetical protein
LPVKIKSYRLTIFKLPNTEIASWEYSPLC